VLFVEESSDMNKQQMLKWLLRLAGIVEMLAFIAVVMPRSWMEVSHEWLGMGEMPGGPLIMFMIRQASYSYGMHGLSLWILSLDVNRFHPLVVFNGIAFLLAGPVFFVIDYSSGMPLWWTVEDSLGCGLFGAGILWLSRKTEG
jgi:hypothetical protein